MQIPGMCIFIHTFFGKVNICTPTLKVFKCVQYSESAEAQLKSMEYIFLYLSWGSKLLSQIFDFNMVRVYAYVPMADLETQNVHSS